MSDLNTLKNSLETQIPEWCGAVAVPGCVAGVYHDGQQIETAWGVANLNSGAGMTTDTLWLLGSITKILTTTLLLRYVERGQVDLDQPVTTYLPDFKLSDPGAAERITVRRLVNHTNGIDADTLFPTADFGPDAVRTYVDTLAQCGTLFEPGESIHYTNPGFSVAARIIEVLSGKTFNQALEDEIYAPVGMDLSCTSAVQAILHNTAIGSFPAPEAGGAYPTGMFMLPVSGAGPGATAIVTIPEIMAFGRTHLDGGVAPNGTRVLAAELAEAMRTETFDLGTPNAPPMGLGWWLVPIAGTTALWHGGGSPGGTSSLAVFPEHDLVVASLLARRHLEPRGIPRARPGGGELRQRRRFAGCPRRRGQGGARGASRAQRRTALRAGRDDGRPGTLCRNLLSLPDSNPHPLRRWRARSRDRVRAL